MLELTDAQAEATRLWVANQQRELAPLTPEQEAATRLWLASLERERFAPVPRKPVEPVVVVKTVEVVKEVPSKAAVLDKKAQRDRDKAMYHAGRFAEGARDEEATAANRIIAAYINGKKK